MLCTQQGLLLRKELFLEEELFLVRAIESLEKLKGDNEDQNVGINIAKRALESPLRQIASNAGEESSVIVAEVRDGKGALGFNAATGEYGDMIEMGILDPAKVTRTALSAAGSVAGMMITTEISWLQIFQRMILQVLQCQTWVVWVECQE